LLGPEALLPAVSLPYRIVPAIPILHPYNTVLLAHVGFIRDDLPGELHLVQPMVSGSALPRVQASTSPRMESVFLPMPPYIPVYAPPSFFLTYKLSLPSSFHLPLGAGQRDRYGMQNFPPGPCKPSRESAKKPDVRVGPCIQLGPIEWYTPHLAVVGQPITAINGQLNLRPASRSQSNRAESGMRLHQRRSC
ncbi:hypothetical protein BO78DRAFT_437179, partial [Aspergillus sclerotiicarbonarius CBS 121057]